MDSQLADAIKPVVDLSTQATQDLTTQGFGKLVSGDLSTMITGLFDIAIAAGTVLAIIRIIYAGWLYMGWADAAGEKSKGKEVFSNAIFGLILLYAIWLILKQINPDLLQVRIFNSNGASAPSAQTTSVPTPAESGITSPAQTPLNANGDGRYNNPGEIPPQAWCYLNGYTKQYSCNSDRAQCEATAGSTCSQTGKEYQDSLPSEQYQTS